ncbi:hypothetical protein ACU8MX_14805 [Rhizobium leguminosarum]
MEIDSPFKTLPERQAAAQLFEQIAQQINQAVHYADVAIGDHPATNSRSEFFPVEWEVSGLKSYQDGMRDLRRALKLLSAAEDRFSAMAGQIEQGEIGSDWKWVYAKNGIRGKRLTVTRGRLGGANYDCPNPMFLLVSDGVEGKATRESIVSVFAENGFEFERLWGDSKEWIETGHTDNEGALFFARDRGPAALYKIDVALRELGFHYVEWTSEVVFDRDGKFIDLYGEIQEGEWIVSGRKTRPLATLCLPPD